MRYVLAVDGGNSKTLALVATLDGAIRSVERGGCGDIYNATPSESAPDPTAAALENVSRTVLAALKSAEVSPDDVAVSVFNMAGADWPEDMDFWRETMIEWGIGGRAIAQNDALGVLSLGAPDAVGVSLVCGSGAATGARGADGRVWHSSYWQDEWHGSTQLGEKTLFAIYRAALGIEPPTSLTQRVLDHFQVASAEDVLYLFHNRHNRAPEAMGNLTPILLDEADAGDAVALRVLREHGAGLGRIAQVAIRKVGLTHSAFPLVLAGGVFRHPMTVLEDAIVANIREGAPAVRPMRSPAEPIIGVLLQALREAGVAVDQSFRDRLLSDIPTVLRSYSAE